MASGQGAALSCESQEEASGDEEDGNGEQDKRSLVTSSSSLRKADRSTRREDPASLIAKILQDIEDLIGRLQRLSVLIRKASAYDRINRIMAYLPRDPAEATRLKEKKEFADALIAHRFPNADAKPRRRVLDAIEFRQKRFQYYKSRRPAVRPPDRPAESNRALPIAAKVVRTPIQPHPPLDAPEPFSRKSRSESRVTPSQINTASAMDENLFRPDAPRSTKPVQSVRSMKQDSTIRWPPPPKPSGENTLECPYCLEILRHEDVSGTAWM